MEMALYADSDLTKKSDYEAPEDESGTKSA